MKKVCTVPYLISFERCGREHLCREETERSMGGTIQPSITKKWRTLKFFFLLFIDLFIFFWGGGS